MKFSVLQAAFGLLEDGGAPAPAPTQSPDPAQATTSSDIAYARMPLFASPALQKRFKDPGNLDPWREPGKRKRRKKKK